MKGLESGNSKFRNNEKSTISALVRARCQLQQKITELRQYRACSPAEINSLKRMGLRSVVISLVGDQRYFDNSAIQQLAGRLNTETSLSWSIRWFDGYAWVCASYHHIMPAMVFSLLPGGNYRLAKFSLNIKRDNERLLLN